MSGPPDHLAEALANFRQELDDLSSDIDAFSTELQSEADNLEHAAHRATEMLQSEFHSALMHVKDHASSVIQHGVESALTTDIEAARHVLEQAFEPTFHKLASLPNIVVGELTSAIGRIEHQIQEEVISEIEHELHGAVNHAVETLLTATADMLITTELSEIITESLEPFVPEIIMFHEIAPVIQHALDLLKMKF